MDLWTYNNKQNYCLASLWTLWDLDLLIHLLHHIPWTFVHCFLNEGGNIWTRGETGQLVKFYGIFKISPSRYPSQGTQVMLTQETKEVWTLQPKPSQAREAAWGVAQARWRSAALPSDYITTPVALVQHCSSRGAAQRSSRQQQGGWGASLWYAGYIIQ